MRATVVSGGQSGVDRAALDAAIALGIPYAGWCPKGGLAEDLPEPPGLLVPYPELRQTPSPDPAQRTEWNVRDSEATLVIRLSGPDTSPGTTLTTDLARDLGRPLLVLDPESKNAIRDARAFLDGLGERARLKFAGPRESQAPGINANSRPLIEGILSLVASA
jgi:hypothetical protein